MALFPQGLTNVDARCTPGERRLLHQLKRCLGDDHLVWHDVPIGPRARQPDFVVLSPRQGILLLEVKDWKRASIVAASRDRVVLRTARGEVTEANPLRRARDVTLELVDVMRRDAMLTHAEGPFAGRLLFPYGWGAVFANLRQSDVAGSDFHDVFPAHQVLLRDALDETQPPEDFVRRLWGMFTVHYPHTLTLPQRDRIRWHLFPELRVVQAALDFGGDAAAGDAAPALPDLLQMMDLQQEQVARTLGEGHRVIHGAAGSGKTMLLVYRAQFLAAAARPEHPVLVLCFNRSLADRIEHLLRERGVDERVQVHTFHAWCADVVRSYALDVPQNVPREQYFEVLTTSVERALASGFVPSGQYCALLVDEAHDFEDAWLRMAVRLVDPATNSLLVLYDDAQSIYQARRRRAFSLARVGIEARGRTSILRVNYRNTAEVLALAVQCAQRLLQREGGAADDELPLVQPTSAGRSGRVPVLLQCRDDADEAAAVAQRIADANAAGRALHEVAILCRTKAQMRPFEAALQRGGMVCQSMRDEAFRRFDWRADSVKLLTLHSAKGLEFPLVFVTGLQSMPMPGESADDAARLLYVAMTRATHDLVLSAHGRSAVVERVRVALDEVARRFAAAP